MVPIGRTPSEGAAGLLSGGGEDAARPPEGQSRGEAEGRLLYFLQTLLLPSHTAHNFTTERAES